MSTGMFRKRVGPLMLMLALNGVAAHCEKTSNANGLGVVEIIRDSRNNREAFRDQIGEMMTAAQFAKAPKKDGEFLKWLIEFIIANLPAIIAMFTVV